MKLRKHLPAQKEGFAIMEAVLAVGIAGIMITAIAIAMKNISRLSFESKREAIISRIIHNELMTHATKPRIQEGQLPSKRIEEWEIEIITNVIPLTEVTNSDGALLDQLFKVEVKATWWEDGDYTTRTAETWRNANLYAQ